MMFSNKDLKNLLCPLVIEQVLVMLVGMVDTVMVSSVGEPPCPAWRWWTW